MKTVVIGIIIYIVLLIITLAFVRGASGKESKE